jgi:hypothetical protein
MKKLSCLVAAALLATPFGALAQARNGNVYDGTAHQPTAGVHTEEQHAGVALPQGRVQAENRDLGQINNELMQRAHHDAQQNPLSTHNVYGVQPGGVVQSTPNAGGAAGTGTSGGG